MTLNQTPPLKIFCVWLCSVETQLRIQSSTCDSNLHCNFVRFSLAHVIPGSSDTVDPDLHIDNSLNFM